MSAKRYSFDTNVLFYALDPDASGKYRIAERLITTADPERAVFLLQTLGELYNSVRRKRPELASDAHRWIQQSVVFLDVISATPADLAEAIHAQQHHTIPFWDGMLWATARRAGCTLLLTEDFNDGQQLGGVLFRNPFTMSAVDLDQILRDS